MTQKQQRSSFTVFGEKVKKHSDKHNKHARQHRMIWDTIKKELSAARTEIALLMLKITLPFNKTPAQYTRFSE